MLAGGLNDHNNNGLTENPEAIRWFVHSESKFQTWSAYLEYLHFLE